METTHLVDPTTTAHRGCVATHTGTRRGREITMAELIYENLSSVPEDLREDAEESTGGKYIVKVSATKKITQFRDNNVKLSQERDTQAQQLTQYEQVTGVTAEELATGKLTTFAKVLEGLRDVDKKVKDGVLVATTSLDEAAAARVTEVTNSWKLQLADSAKDREAHKSRADAAEARANQMQVENSVRLAASDPAVAMLDKAVNLLLPAAMRVFKVDESGKLVPKTADGTTIYGSDGVREMTVKEWLLKQRDENDFLFKGSKGGGANGGSAKESGRLTAAELDGMSSIEKINYARKHGLK
jgi:hypothetical protein